MESHTSSTRMAGTVGWGKPVIWSTAAPAITAAFLASMVEVVEAFTIVLAIATLRGWRPAVLGTTAGLALLAGIVLLLGPLLDRVPVASLQLGIGILLLLFGMGWLRKASLRAAGIIPLHDEDAIFAAETAQLDELARRQQRNLTWVAGIAALKAVLLEGLEVVFIVVAVGAGRGLLVPASLGALAACALVLAIGAVVHRPLSRVPENLLKFGVGVMLSSFGVFWTGEGLGIAWPGQDLALLLFIALFLGAGLIASALARKLSVEFA
jgi:Ca2+/H+ antiporter, TMEM165/GDT1 family